MAADGTPCATPAAQHDVDSSTESMLPWRDLARRMQTVDEISLTVPSGALGWLLAEIVVTAVRQPLGSAKKGGSVAESGTEDFTPDPVEYAVQVFPGPYAVIVEASRAAVLYHADDMLEQGKRLTSSTRKVGPFMTLDTDVQTTSSEAGAEDDPENDIQVKLHSFRSVEGLR